MSRHLRSLCLAAVSVAVMSLPSKAQDTPASPAPAVDPNTYTWDLGDLYSTPDDWSAAYDKLQAGLGDLASCKTTITRDAGSMLACLQKISAEQKDLLRLYTYAMLMSDENLGNAENTARKAQAQTLLAQFGASTAWLNPAILSAGKAKIDAYRKQQPQLEQTFGFMLDNVLRAAPHTLSPEAEQVMAQSQDVLGRPSNVYDIFSAAELPFPTITLSDGKSVVINQANYTLYRQAANRDDRKKVFDAFWGEWKKFEGTLGANLSAHVAGHVFEAKARNYKNSLEAAEFADAMPETVYRTLVAQVNENLPALHRYFKLRKRMLGINDDMGYYDIYPPIVQLDKKFPVEEAKPMILAALAPLGDDYLNDLKKVWSSRWIHLYPQQGKASGGYMMGAAYDVHPYLLLNYNDDYESMSTLAHESGHAVHTMLDKQAQPFEKSDYSTFVAETASIMNEMLLQDYMAAHAQTKQEKLFYLDQALESMRGTWFRQTMFAEFELKVHDEAEAGKALSGARMSEIYCDLLKKYHGDAEGVVKIDPTYCIEWAYIPHFYRDFYVYQYATSITGAALLAQRIESGDPKQRDIFLDMLKAGGSAYPYDIYKKAGIDMATPEPYQALVKRMNAIMDQMETLLAQP